MPVHRTTLIFDQLPPEIYPEIGSNLTGKELDGVTRASKRLRVLFLRSLFHTIRFDHLQPGVRDSLRRFINGRTPEEMTEIWTAVRCASFLFPFPDSIDDFDLEEMLPASQDALRLQVLQAVRLLSQVRRLSIDLERFGDGHIDTFRAALPSAPRWVHLKSLRLTGLGENRRFTAALIHNCSPDKLMAIDLSGTHSFLLSVDAQRHCKRLERLRLEHPFPPFNADSFPAMQHVYGMWESFPHVKWLSIVEKNHGREGNMDTFDQCFEQMTGALQQMPNLLRFAFTLDIDRFQPDEIRDRLGLDENDNEALTDNQMLEWYTGQIQRISDAAPQLQEVCLFGNFCTSMGIDIAGVYRGTKVEDGKRMRVLLDAVQPGVECLTFPWGLDDDEHSLV
ncbi:hypothetical protein NW754_013499 [Fusarium falciforme]|nr:hypothetical protein NW754_013499 [Fusarium falciforme]